MGDEMEDLINYNICPSTECHTCDCDITSQMITYIFLTIKTLLTRLTSITKLHTGAGLTNLDLYLVCSNTLQKCSISGFSVIGRIQNIESRHADQDCPAVWCECRALDRVGAQYAWQMIPARQEKVNIECLQMLPFSHTIYHLTKHQTPLHSIFQSVLVSNHNDGGSLF